MQTRPASQHKHKTIKRKKKKKGIRCVSDQNRSRPSHQRFPALQGSDMCLLGLSLAPLHIFLYSDWLP